MSTSTLENVAKRVLASPKDVPDIREYMELEHLVGRLLRTKQKTPLILNALQAATGNTDTRIVWRALDGLINKNHIVPEAVNNAARVLTSDSSNAKESAIRYLTLAEDFGHSDAVSKMIGELPDWLSNEAERYCNRARRK